mgnify:CR=1 FL=1
MVLLEPRQLRVDLVELPAEFFLHPADVLEELTGHGPSKNDLRLGRVAMLTIEVFDGPPFHYP